MPDYRVLVTGSRDWSDRVTIRSALMRVEREHEDSRLILVHGMCDPRHPLDGHAIRWAAAMRLPMGVAENLLGADWLASLIAATSLGWETEPRPADWKHHGRAAGYRRNEHMIRLGAGICLAFSMPCTAPRCAGRPAHGSHGTTQCSELAERAKIPVRRYGDA